MLPLKVINFWAGPGAGKSTTAAGLFNLMKHEGYAVELVTEYAKDLTYEQDWATLGDPLKVFKEQAHRLRRLVGHAEWAITDSPLPLGTVYDKAKSSSLSNVIWDAFYCYANLNIFVDRTKGYSKLGRTQTEEEAVSLDHRIRFMWAGASGPRLAITGDRNAPYEVLKWLQSLPAKSQSGQRTFS